MQSITITLKNALWIKYKVDIIMWRTAGKQYPSIIYTKNRVATVHSFLLFYSLLKNVSE